MTEKKKNVYQKISCVMASVEYLKKDGNVSYGSTSYNYLSEEKITSSIRKAMIEQGLTMYPVKTEIIPDQPSFEKAVVTYRIVNNDNPEDFIEVQVGGKGQDRGDKSMCKAMTGAFKYAQRQTFMISTGDDPDKVHSNEFSVTDGNGNLDFKATEMANAIGDTKNMKVKEVLQKQIKFLTDKLSMGRTAFNENVYDLTDSTINDLPQNTLAEIKTSLYNNWANGVDLVKVKKEVKK
jgi:hypothetical protein